MATKYKLIRVDAGEDGESGLYAELTELAKNDHRTITQYTNLKLKQIVEAEKANVNEG